MWRETDVRHTIKTLTGVTPAVRLRRVHYGPSGAGGRATPVVFVHGAWHGAWCWERHFLPYFARHGHQSYAFDLRGHGGSTGADRLRHTRIADYVDDLGRVVEDLGGAPVVVGHSLGGTVVQKYLETRSAAAAVLLASVPAAGGLGTAVRLAARHPVTMLKATVSRSLRPIVATPERAREAFFSPGIADARLAAFFSRLQDESYAAFLDVVVRVRPRPDRVRTRMLVLGADRDTFITRQEVRATARAYGTTAAFFPMAHDMMLEEGWQAVADHILRWIAQLPRG
jgi:pimeloyl-ACP methyl ester carboxylesterase